MQHCVTWSLQYTLLAGIYIEGILASAAYADSVSVIFPVMLAAAPQLLTERFWRMIVVTYACCLLHILVAFHTKAPTLAWLDAIHIAVFSVSGFCAHYFDSRLRIKTFLTGLRYADKAVAFGAQGLEAQGGT